MFGFGKKQARQNVFTPCRVEGSGMSYRGLVAESIYSDYELNPDDRTQKFLHGLSATGDSYQIPDTYNGLPVLATHPRTIYISSGSYYLGKNVLFVPLEEFCSGLRRGRDGAGRAHPAYFPRWHSGRRWRLALYRSVPGRTYEVLDGRYKDDCGNALYNLDISAYGTVQLLAQHMAVDMIRHEGRKMEIGLPWEFCFVPDDVGSFKITFG